MLNFWLLRAWPPARTLSNPMLAPIRIARDFRNALDLAACEAAHSRFRSCSRAPQCPPVPRTAAAMG